MKLSHQDIEEAFYGRFKSCGNRMATFEKNVLYEQLPHDTDSTKNLTNFLLLKQETGKVFLLPVLRE